MAVNIAKLPEIMRKAGKLESCQLAAGARLMSLA
jgi:hypothetical protein